MIRTLRRGAGGAVCCLLLGSQLAWGDPLPVPVSSTRTVVAHAAPRLVILAPAEHPLCSGALLARVDWTGAAGATVMGPSVLLCGTRGAVAGTDELECLPDPILQALLDAAGLPDPAGGHPVGDAVAQLYQVEDQAPIPAGAPSPARTAGGLMDCRPPYAQPATPTVPQAPVVPDPALAPAVQAPLPRSQEPVSGLVGSPASAPSTAEAAPVLAAAPRPATLSSSNHAVPRLRSNGILALAALLACCAAGAVGLSRLLASDPF